MKKKIVSVLLAMSVVVAFSVPCYGTINNSGPQTEEIISSAEEQADIVEVFTGTDEIIGDFSENQDSFSVEENSIEVDIPKDASDEINIGLKEEKEDIGLELPEVVDDSEVVITDDGTAVYESNDEAVSVAVQAHKDKMDEIDFDCVRELVTINDASAPHEYAFSFNLPDGYEIVTSEEYYEGSEEENTLPGYVFIIDTNSVYISDEENEELDDIEETDLNSISNYEIVWYVEPAWAKDVNGKKFLHIMKLMVIR